MIKRVKALPTGRSTALLEAPSTRSGAKPNAVTLIGPTDQEAHSVETFPGVCFVIFNGGVNDTHSSLGVLRLMSSSPCAKAQRSPHTIIVEEE